MQKRGRREGGREVEERRRGMKERREEGREWGREGKVGGKEKGGRVMEVVVWLLKQSSLMRLHSKWLVT